MDIQADKKVFQFFVGDMTFCNICLRDLKDENSYYFKDKVVLDSTKKNIELAELLSFILGLKTASIYASGIVCQQCLHMTITSYKFIQMCKLNIELLNKSVSILEDRINRTVEEKNNMTPLLITLEHHTHKDKCSTSIYGNKNLKNDINKYEFSIESKGCVPHNMKKVKNEVTNTIEQYKKRYKTKSIPINEIILDIKNLSQCKCKICLNSYSNLYRLRQHFLRVHAPKNFTCPDCFRGYGSAALLAQHKYDCHNVLTCSVCGKSYTNRSNFKTHIQSHQSNIICQLCGKNFKNKRGFSKHIKLNICDPEQRKINLVKNKKYVCDYCMKRYSSKSSLQAHIKIEHGDGKAHICSWCNKKFHAVSRLTAHIVTHTQEKKFNCNHCRGQFVTKASLLYHTRIHTGEKPYACEYCDNRFLSTSRRAEHVRRHHREAMIQCNVCNSKFRNRSCLTRHEKRHFNPNSRLHYTRLILDEKDI